VDALIRILSQNNDIEIVAIGMLTNIASAITKSPSIIKNIKQLTIMGGQLNHIIYNENIFPFGIDYNLCSDPFSAMIVFTSEIKNIKLITADVTLRTWLTQEDYNILKKISENSNYLKFLLKDIDNWTLIQKKIFNDNNIDNIAFLHDPLTIGCAIMDNESFCNFQEYNIEPLISLNSSINKLQFRTIIHNNEIPNLTKKIQCSTNVNSEKFRQFLIERFINYFCKI
jgi:inosine-uridine nucleoside N-ribohydrolase